MKKSNQIVHVQITNISFFGFGQTGQLRGQKIDLLDQYAEGFRHIIMINIHNNINFVQLPRP